MTTTFEIQQHPTSAAHVVAIATTPRGFVYACTYAEPHPTLEEVREDWRTYGTRGNKGFRPYSTVHGQYVG